MAWSPFFHGRKAGSVRNLRGFMGEDCRFLRHEIKPIKHAQSSAEYARKRGGHVQ